MPQTIRFDFPGPKKSTGGKSDLAPVVLIGGIVLAVLYLWSQTQEPKKTLPFSSLIASTYIKNKINQQFYKFQTEFMGRIKR